MIFLVIVNFSLLPLSSEQVCKAAFCSNTEWLLLLQLEQELTYEILSEAAIKVESQLRSSNLQ